ncbi:MAG TPA: phosphatase PAP2 family protein, partial [Streptosporangiaceae bacterium]|nr:phosphatase PAP2 family protein [Streptosporangiaceae bacterium]
GWWRFLFLVPAIAMPVLVIISRMYRGEHHPTDVLGSLVFAALWLTATTMLIKPTAVESPTRRDEHDGRTLRAAKKTVHAPGKALR